MLAGISVTCFGTHSLIALTLNNGFSPEPQRQANRKGCQVREKRESPRTEVISNFEILHTLLFQH